MDPMIIVNCALALYENIQKAQHNKKQLQVLAEKIKLLSDAVLESFGDVRDVPYDPALAPRLEAIKTLIEEVNQWVIKQNSKSCLKQIAQNGQVQDKIQLWHVKLDAHFKALDVRLNSWDSNKLMIAKQEDTEAILADIHAILMQRGPTLDQILGRLSINHTGFVDGMTRLEGLLNNYGDRMKGAEDRISALLDNLKQKSGRTSTGSFPDWLSIPVDDIVFLDEEPIGSGSYGEVWKATHNDREVAVKRSHEIIRGSEAINTIQSELMILYKLNHPNVIRIYGGSVKTDRPFMVVPFFKNGDVYSFIRFHGDKVSMKHRLKLTLEVAKGMRYLHSKNVIHGDLKGDNVLVDDTYSGVITDFGLSQTRTQTASSETKKKKETGAVRWIAPERYKFKGKRDPYKLDVFAFAMTAYQIVSGKLPFFEEKDDDVVKEYIKDGETPTRPDSVSDAMWSLVEECLHVNPEKRLAFEAIVPQLQVIYEHTQGTLFTGASQVQDVVPDSVPKTKPVDSGVYSSSLVRPSPQVSVIIDEKATTISPSGFSTPVRGQSVVVTSPNRYQPSSSSMDKAKPNIPVTPIPALSPATPVTPFTPEQTGQRPTVEQLNQRLFLAVQNNDTVAVSIALAEGADVNAKNSDTHTSLHIAAKQVYTDVVKILLKYKANVNARDGRGWTPLNYVALNGDSQIAQLLINHGAIVDCCTDEGDTPLIDASDIGNTELVKLLIDRKANVNAQGQAGKNALQCAAYQGHLEVVKVLLANKAHVNAKNKVGWGPLISAASNGHLEIVRLLLQHKPDINAQNMAGETPLLHAAMYGHKQVIQLLLDHGADLTIKDNFGKTALDKSIEQKHTQIAEMLQDADTKRKHAINQQKKQPTLPLNDPIHKKLIWASRNYGVEDVNKFISEGADVNVKDAGNWTPLLYAAQRGNHDIVKILLDNGADPKVENKNGDTASSLALTFGFVNVTQLLNGTSPAPTKIIMPSIPAKVAAQSAPRDQQLLAATKRNDLAEIEKLLSEGANVNVQDNRGFTPLHWAASKDYISIVKTLQIHKANANIQNMDGDTPLILATCENLRTMTYYLVDFEIDINMKGNKGMTALHHAASQGFSEIVQRLISLNADVNIKADNGYTPLHYAAESGRTWTVEYLIEKGANVNALDKNGSTPLKVAMSKRHNHIVNILKDVGGI